VTPQALQVFYRDESQGILLGAVKTSNGWVYEIVDGDKDYEGRTTGDVGKSLAATTVGNSTYLIYNSILSLSTNGKVLSSDVRLAKRKSVFPEDWVYTRIDGTSDTGVASGDLVTISRERKKIILSWTSNPNVESSSSVKIMYSLLGNDVSGMQKDVLRTDFFGYPKNFLSIEGKFLFFDCSRRVCAIDLSRGAITLVSGKEANYAKYFKTKKGLEFFVSLLRKTQTLVVIELSKQ
jgi:hypothetical protein